MTFREWLDLTFYPEFDPSGVSDEEFYALEDAYNEYKSGVLTFVAEYANI